LAELKHSNPWTDLDNVASTAQRRTVCYMSSDLQRAGVHSGRLDFADTADTV